MIVNEQPRADAWFADDLRRQYIIDRDEIPPTVEDGADDGLEKLSREELLQRLRSSRASAPQIKSELKREREDAEPADETEANGTAGHDVSQTSKRPRTEVETLDLTSD